MTRLLEYSFLTLCYNHQKYIIEHLESIKYIIDNYGSNIKCNLIINDDCSVDNTVSIIERWLNENSEIFSSVIKLYNKKNIGTCASVLNMLENCSTEHLKLTAGDDVYSYENIFEYSRLESDVSILGGYPLRLVDGVLSKNRFDIYTIVASEAIYADYPLIDRLKLPSNNNAPNIIYNRKCLSSTPVLNFIKDFDIIDDWALQIAIAENFPDTIFKQVDKVFVYYRRTLGSAFLVANDRFHTDKCKLYCHLINKEKSKFHKLILRNRMYVFNLNNILLKKLLNFSFYLFVISCVFKARRIKDKLKALSFDLSRHREHYEMIKKRASYYE